MQSTLKPGSVQRVQPFKAGRVQARRHVTCSAAQRGSLPASLTVTGAAALQLLAAPAMAATEAVSQVADGSAALALGGGAAIAALSAALIVADPSRR